MFQVVYTVLHPGSCLVSRTHLPTDQHKLARDIWIKCRLRTSIQKQTMKRDIRQNIIRNSLDYYNITNIDRIMGVLWVESSEWTEGTHCGGGVLVQE